MNLVELNVDVRNVEVAYLDVGIVNVEMVNLKMDVVNLEMVRRFSNPSQVHNSRNKML